jgi:hypothetical protein
MRLIQAFFPLSQLLLSGLSYLDIRQLKDRLLKSRVSVYRLLAHFNNDIRITLAPQLQTALNVEFRHRVANTTKDGWFTNVHWRDESVVYL